MTFEFGLVVPDCHRIIVVVVVAAAAAAAAEEVVFVVGVYVV